RKAVYGDDDVAGAQAGSAAHFGRYREDQRAFAAAHVALGLDLRRDADDLEVAQNGYLLGRRGGEVAGLEAADCDVVAMADPKIDGIADVEVELRRLPVEVVPKRAAVRRDEHVTRADARARARAAGRHARYDHAAGALP